MSKKHGWALAITLVLGIILGVSATGAVFANSTPDGVSSMMGGISSHMGIGNMADHHSSADMPEGCDQDISMAEDCPYAETHNNSEDSNFTKSGHHQNMHR